MDYSKTQPTLYKGKLFSSMLKARWAVFFDNLPKAKSKPKINPKKMETNVSRMVSPAPCNNAGIATIIF